MTFAALVGARVELLRCGDPWTQLRPGARGEVVLVDATLGTLHVRWDDGSTLGLVPNEDSWRVLSVEERAEEVCS